MVYFSFTILNCLGYFHGFPFQPLGGPFSLKCFEWSQVMVGVMIASDGVERGWGWARPKAELGRYWRAKSIYMFNLTQPNKVGHQQE